MRLLLPTNVASMKSMVENSVQMIRWSGWRVSWCPNRWRDRKQRIWLLWRPVLRRLLPRSVLRRLLSRLQLLPGRLWLASNPGTWGRPLLQTLRIWLAALGLLVSGPEPAAKRQPPHPSWIELSATLISYVCHVGRQRSRMERPYRAGRCDPWLKVKNRKHLAFSRIAEQF
jgi:hypothetical protein